MPPGSWFLMKKSTGFYGPDSLLSCPNCGGDIVAEGDFALGKRSYVHPARVWTDPRKPGRIFTQACGVTVTLKAKDGYAEY
jgi:hypothetical protein